MSPECPVFVMWTGTKTKAWVACLASALVKFPCRRVGGSTRFKQLNAVAYTHGDNEAVRQLNEAAPTLRAQSRALLGLISGLKKTLTQHWQSLVRWCHPNTAKPRQKRRGFA